jgi:hypothetical protein
MEGQVVPAASGAPADAVGKQGRLQLTARDTVRHARSVWKAWRVFVPYNAIGLPRGWEVKLMLMVTAECNRKRFTMEVPCTLRLP